MTTVPSPHQFDKCIFDISFVKFDTFDDIVTYSDLSNISTIFMLFTATSKFNLIHKMG